MKMILNQIKKHLKNEKGAGIVEFIIILVVSVVIGTTVLPPIMNKISAKGTSTSTKVETIDTLFKITPPVAD